MALATFQWETHSLLILEPTQLYLVTCVLVHLSPRERETWRAAPSLACQSKMLYLSLPEIGLRMSDKWPSVYLELLSLGKKTDGF